MLLGLWYLSLLSWVCRNKSWLWADKLLTLRDKTGPCLRCIALWSTTRDLVHLRWRGVGIASIGKVSCVRCARVVGLTVLIHYHARMIVVLPIQSWDFRLVSRLLVRGVGGTPARASARILVTAG